MAYTYEWDFSRLYKNRNGFESDIKEFDVFTQKIVDLQGRLDNRADILNYLAICEKAMQKLSRLEIYVMLRLDKDTTNAQNLKDYERVMKLATTYSVKTAFVQPELAKNSDEFLNELINDSELKAYSRVFESILKEKPHTLSKEKEELLAGIGEFTDYSDVFEKLTGVEIPFKDVVVNGVAEKLNDATYSKFIKSKDENVRRQAYENLLEGFSKYNLTLSQCLISHLKKRDFLAKTYNYKSVLSQSLFNEEVNETVFNNLIKTVNNNLGLYQKYLKKKAKVLGKKKLYASDINAPLGEMRSLNLNYEDAVNFVLDLVSVFGEDYKSVATEMFVNGSIDVYPKEGKRSGGYSASGQIGEHFILLNYNNSYFDFSTIAHELGHSMHSYYSEKNQPYFNQDYVIFVAEIASTVNEVLLAKKLLKQAKTDEERTFVADSLLSEFCASVFRQTMFSEFELYTNNAINKEIPLSFEELNNEYSKLQSKYFKDAVQLSEFSKYEWSRIPHFYRNFYVYKYATGFISAVAIAKQIEEGGLDYVENHYKKFLSAGSSADPISILKLANVDITTDEPYQKAFQYFDELIELIK